MKVAFGLKAHSGWAALVVLGMRDREPVVVERLRVELVDEADGSWAKQPYHAAEDLKMPAAAELVGRGIRSARRLAVQELRKAVGRAQAAGHEVVACGVLVVDPMPAWSVEEILSVHFRMHKAEGVLFRDALSRAATTCDLRLIEVSEKRIETHAVEVLATPVAALRRTIVSLGVPVGPPWGKDQKDAALAALIALRARD